MTTINKGQRATKKRLYAVTFEAFERKARH